VRVGSLALLLVLGLVALLPGSVYAADGDLDPTFSSPDPDMTVYALAVQPDGKVLIGGNFYQVGGATRQGVARLNADGTLDTSFINPAVTGGGVRALVLLSDGKVLIGGGFSYLHQGGVYYWRYGVARLNSDGTIDTSFVDPAVLYGDRVHSMARQSDGKIVIGGDFSQVGGQPRVGVARLNADGTLDASFGNLNLDSYVEALAIQSDGKVLMGGLFTSVGGQTRNRVARLNSDGTLDTFNPNANTHVYALALQSDGKVLMGGDFTSVGGTTRNRVARLNSDGTLDTFDPNANDKVYALALQSDGKVLMGGDFTSVGGTTMRRVARLNADGSLDTSFNDPNANGTVRALKQQSDGKVLIGGGFSSVGGTTMRRVARLNTAKPTAVTLSSFHATAPTLDLWQWLTRFLGR